MRWLVIPALLAMSGLLQADNVTCSIQSPLTGTCTSQTTGNLTVSGSAAVTIGGPGSYTPPPDSQLSFEFNGPIGYSAAYTFAIQNMTTSAGNGTGTITITLTSSLPNPSGELALIGAEGSSPFLLPGEGALIPTNLDGFHGGLDLCVEAGCEDRSALLFPAAGVPLQATFFETLSPSNQTSAFVTVFEVVPESAVPEPALWPIAGTFLLLLLLPLTKRKIRL